jgi:hypothetical protein
MLAPAKTHRSDDAAAIGVVLDELYSVISFEEGDEPNLERLKRLFSEHARITRVTPEGTDYLTPTSFVEMTKNMLELGAYTSFYEFEVTRRTERFGDVAQVWSFYETRRNRGARDALSRGINSIQLVIEAEDWKVFSLLWDDAHANPSLDFEKQSKEASA